MNGQVKSRRWVIIIVGFSIVVLAAGLVGFSSWRRQHREEAWRTEGLAAAKAGDHRQAIDKLSLYVENNRDDVEVVESLAFAIEASDPHSIDVALRTITLLRHAVDLAPDHHEARRKLIDLYFKTAQPTDVLRGAETLLHSLPDDESALLSKAKALIAIKRDQDALTTAQSLVKKYPADFEAQKIIIELMSVLKVPASELESHIQELLAAGPANADHLILAAIGNAYLEKSDKAKECAVAAAAKHPTDPKLVESLIKIFDSLGMYDDSLAVLKSAANVDPKNRRALIQRYWEMGHWQEAVDQFQLVSDVDARNYAAMVGLAALAHIQLGHMEQANALVARLQSDAENDSAVSWSMTIGDILGKKPDPEAFRKAITKALSIDGADPVLLYELANLMASTGEIDMAMARWQQASVLAPLWPVPSTKVAGIMVQSRHFDEAVELMNHTIACSPDNLSIPMGFIFDWFNSIKTHDDTSSGKLLEVVNELQKIKPGDGLTLPIQVELIARSKGSAAAQARLTQILAASDRLTQESIMALVGVSWRYRLQQQKPLLDRYESGYGMTAELAFARAIDMVLNNDSAGARSYLETTMKAQPQTPANQMAWGMNWARLLDGLNDPAAAQVWTSLIASFPQKSVIESALSSRWLWQDPSATDTLIGQLRQLGGPDNLEYRWNRARWLLWQKSDKASLDEANGHLKAVLAKQPRQLGALVMLGNCLREQGDAMSAMKEFQIADDLFPGTRDVQLELAITGSELGMTRESREALNRFLLDPGNDPAQLRQAASMLISDGKNDLANQLLDRAWKVDPAPADIRLARLYDKLKRNEQTNAICDALLLKPDLERLEFVADYRARAGRMDDAKAALNLMDKLQLPAGAALCARARFAAVYEKPDAARELFENAVKAGPSLAMNWLSLLTFDLSQGDGRISSDLSRALAAAPEDATLKELNGNAELLTASVSDQAWRALGIAMVTDQANRPKAIEALKLLRLARSTRRISKDDPILDESTIKLQALSDANPRFLALQNALIDRYQYIGQLDLASKLATRTMSTFPSEFDVARRAATLLGQTGKWDESLSVAEDLKRRSPESAISADLMAAQALVETGHLQAALEHTKPYLEMATKNPEVYFPILTTHGQILILTDKPDEANNLMKSSLGTNYSLRAQWMLIAARLVKDPQLPESWLEQETKSVPADQVDARNILANAWSILAARNKRPEDNARAVELLKGMADSDLSFESLCLLASRTDSTKDRDSVIRYYRLAVKMRPDIPGPMNNLAFYLSSDRATLNEALSLARTATTIDPKNPNYLDTMATIQSRMGDYDGALSSIQTAITYNNEITWQLTRVELEIAADRRIEARDHLKKTVADFTGVHLNTEDQTRLDALTRQLLTPTTSPAK